MAISIEDIVRLLMPHNAVGYNKLRVGKDNDGGYVMLDDLHVPLVISGGICDDDSWEVDIKQSALCVVAFDPDNQYLPSRAKNIALYSERLTSLDPYVGTTAIVKLDIEGDEYEVIRNTQLETFLHIKQFVCEFHGLWPTHAAQYIDVFEKLHTYFRVIHVHGNNCDTVVQHNGLNIPVTLEVTFANMQHYDLIPSDEYFPTELDQPCNPSLSDIVLKTFKY